MGQGLCSHFCYALQQKYHLPCPPPLLQNFFIPTYVPQNDQRDRAVILRHLYWAPGASPSGRPPDPPPPTPP